MAWFTATTTATSVQVLTERQTSWTRQTTTIPVSPNLQDFINNPGGFPQLLFFLGLIGLFVGALHVAYPDLKAILRHEPTPVVKKNRIKKKPSSQVNRTYALASFIAGGVAGYYLSQWLKTPIELTILGVAVVATYAYVKYAKQPPKPQRVESEPEQRPPSESTSKEPASPPPGQVAEDHTNKDLEQLGQRLRKATGKEKGGTNHA